ncbi:MAG: 4-(cytidine 5'-diphospho)-2-C-methyl-D-erythritol kinase [Planctomycetaceae bacterium]|nr:4-(cytidine 5'-diphospho)-2-C-methyl-D-erythritol kinase [Planctomycetaceae bacterium]
MPKARLSANQPGLREVLTVRSRAKVNVFLEVLGKRTDGYHELDTVMLRTELHDVLQLEFPEDVRSDEVRLTVIGDRRLTSAIPCDESNLIIKAARALRAATGIHQPVSITLQKRIPAQAGLAGGSSNAAAALCALNRLWKTNLPQRSLHEIAAGLGSDINFFVEDCRAARCTGRGETVKPIALCGSPVVIVMRPQSGNSTPRVFSELASLPSSELRSSDEILAALKSGSLSQIRRAAFNRLTNAAVRLNPEMGEMLQAVQRRTGLPVLMSGSGSTCFVVVENVRRGRRLLSVLRNIDCSFLCLTRIH